MESGFFSGFSDWLLALTHHWELVVVTGCIPFLIYLLDQLLDWKMPKKVYLGFIVIGLLLASFAAWRDEAAVVASRDGTITDLNKRFEELTKPKFSIASPESAFGYQPKTGMTVLWVSVGVTNLGAPSIAGNWQLEFQSPTINTTLNFVELEPLAGSNGLESKFKDEDSIYEKTMEKPIEKGAAVLGWAEFKIPGRQAWKDLDEAKVMMHLVCYDYLSRMHRSEAFHVGIERTPPAYLPGIKSGIHTHSNDSKQH